MKRFWNWFCSLSRSRQIALGVLGVHLAAIAALLMNQLLIGRPQLKRSIGVRTTALPRTEIPIAPAATAQKGMVKGEVKPLPSSQSKPAATVKKEKTVVKSEPKKMESGSKKAPSKANSKEVSNIDEGILKQISESLNAAIAPAQQTRPSFAVSLPSAIVTKAAIDADSASNAPSYGEAFAAILQNSLDLPEFGEVKAKIEIDADGMVVGVEILDARSRKNSVFLKKRLQELLFPCFNEFGLSEKRLNFTVTFRNVENR